MSSKYSNLDIKLQGELFKLDDGVPFNPVTSHLHHTWANTFYSRPELYFQPTSFPELQKIVTLARRCRKRIVVIGYAHSPSDLTCTSSWMINLDKFNSILSIDANGLANFQAGISLHDLNLALAAKSFTMPNLGSIDNQSIAGAISTGTHGSSLSHGLLSQSITSLTILLSNGQPVTCTATKNPALFRAALLSLGALGILVEITFQSVPDFNISWTQSLHPLTDISSLWSSTLWTSAEYTRIWWLPYLHRAVFWRAHRTPDAPKPPPTTFYGGSLGYYAYHNLLYLAHYLPSILPYIEWFIFGMQYGFRPGSTTMTAIQPAREGLLMDCLYSQFVNEWALPLSKGPEAIARLSAWINGDAATARIPYSSRGVYVHCPIEVRVSDTSDTLNKSSVRPFLDPTCKDGPTLYLNATLYRPYGLDPPGKGTYYQAFEYLMRELGGRPHWAKNFAWTSREEFQGMYGKDLDEFIQVREECDPQGMFVGEWHDRTFGWSGPIAEAEVARGKIGNKGCGDGILWSGERKIKARNEERLEKVEGNEDEEEDREIDWTKLGGSADNNGNNSNGSNNGAKTPATSASEESFDYMAKGEASVYSSGSRFGEEEQE